MEHRGDPPRPARRGLASFPVPRPSPGVIKTSQSEELFISTTSLSQPKSLEEAEQNSNRQQDSTFHELPYKIIYEVDATNALVVNRLITYDGLKEVLIQHEKIRFATFESGLEESPSRFPFHERLVLRNLQSLTIQIPNQGENLSLHKNSILPPEFLRVLFFLREVEFGNLQRIRIICPPEIALSFPIASVFLPSYEMQNCHPLIDIIRKNKTVHAITLGEPGNEFYVKWSTNPRDAIGEPKNYPRIQALHGFQNFPILPSWSVMLQPQRNLTRLNVAFSHAEVWDDVCTAIEMSSEHLKVLGLILMPLDGKAVSLDLKVLRYCSSLRELCVNYVGSNVIGWGFLPGGLKLLSISGPLSHANTEIIGLTLPLLEEVVIHLDSRILGSSKSQKPLDIARHPAFHFVTAHPRNLKQFSIESNDVQIDRPALRNVIDVQQEFRLLEKANGSFSLVREVQPSSTLDTTLATWATNVWMDEGDYQDDGVHNDREQDEMICGACLFFSNEAEDYRYQNDSEQEQEDSVSGCFMGLLSWQNRYS